jgi:nucleoside-diphosphate-sugar epimerase
MVNASLNAEIEKFCYVSSVATLGRNKENENISEQTLWEYGKHNSNYAISKYGAEREVWRGFNEGLKGVIVNPSIILGEGDWTMDSSSIIGRVAEGLKFYTDGVSGFVDARDVSRCMINLMESYVTNERYVVSSQNIPFKTLSEKIALELKLKPPSFHVSKSLLEAGWWIEALRTSVTGKKSLITKESARSAVKKYFYSNEKIKKELNFSFIPIDETVKDVCAKFLQRT